MFGLFPRSRRRTPSARPRSTTRLCLEWLETRDCPTAPALHALAQASAGHNYFFYGNVGDPNPTACVVDLGGVVSGSTTPDSTGYFSITLTASSLGTATLVAINGQGLASGTVNFQLSNMVPSVQDNLSMPQKRSVTIAGTVQDEDLTGCTVTISGRVNGSTTPDATGHFSFTADASGLGAVTIKVTDPWQQSPTPADLQVTSKPPSIDEFDALEEPAHVWEFKGTVSDESRAGLTVVLGGLASVNGKTATVQSDGTFDTTVLLRDGENGTVTANVSDWWGLPALTASQTVHQTT
jgi:hypothetical protein